MARNSRFPASRTPPRPTHGMAKVRFSRLEGQAHFCAEAFHDSLATCLLEFPGQSQSQSVGRLRSHPRFVATHPASPRRTRMLHRPLLGSSPRRISPSPRLSLNSSLSEGRILQTRGKPLLRMQPMWSCLHERGSRYFCMAFGSQELSSMLLFGSRASCLSDQGGRKGIAQSCDPGSTPGNTPGAQSNGFHLASFRRREPETHVRTCHTELVGRF
jgi:hypothetical protein